VEPPKQNPPCIYCGGENVIKGGWIPRRHGDIQRYICKDCRRTFIPREEETPKHISNHAGQYKHLKDAEGYAARLREIGDQVEIREVTMYDVIVTGRCKK